MCVYSHYGIPTSTLTTLLVLYVLHVTHLMVILNITVPCMYVRLCIMCCNSLLFVCGAPLHVVVAAGELEG